MTDSKKQKTLEQQLASELFDEDSEEK